jgi:hypothetical protein
MFEYYRPYGIALSMQSCSHTMPEASSARGPLDPNWFAGPPAPQPLQQQHHHQQQQYQQQLHMQAHLQQQQVQAEPSAPHETVFAKHDLLWYRDRAGMWQPAKVTYVDLSLQPPAYQIQMEGDGAIKDTEGSRLRPRALGEAPPAPGMCSPLPCMQPHSSRRMCHPFSSA